MKTERTIDVATFDLPHRPALVEVIEPELGRHPQLIIRVHEVHPGTKDVRPVQTLKGWSGVYEGWSDADVDSLDALINTRADLRRKLP